MRFFGRTMSKQVQNVAILASRIKEIDSKISFEELKDCKRNHHIYEALVRNVKHPKLKKMKKERYYWEIQHNVGNIKQYFDLPSVSAMVPATPISSKQVAKTELQDLQDQNASVYSESPYCIVQESQTAAASYDASRYGKTEVKGSKTSTPVFRRGSESFIEIDDVSPIKKLDSVKRSLHFSSPDRCTSENLSYCESVSSPEYFFTNTSSIDKSKKVKTDLNITSDEIEIPDSILNLSGERSVTKCCLPVGSRNIRKEEFATPVTYSNCSYYEGSFVITHSQWNQIFVKNRFESRMYPYFFRNRIRTYVNNTCNIAFKKIKELKNMFKIFAYCRHNYRGCKKFVIEVDKKTAADKSRSARVFSSSLDFCHTYKLTDQVSGVSRDVRKNKLLGITPLQHRKNEIKKLDTKFVLSTRNLLGVKSQSTIRKIRSEASNASKRSDSDIIDLYLYRNDHPEYVKQICHPLNIKIYSAEQIKISESSEDGVVYFDATGTVVRYQSDKKQVLYYCGVVKVSETRRLCPVMEMVSCEHDTESIYNLFARFRAFCLGLKSPIPFHTLVTDFSFANMHAAIRAFNAMYFQEYLKVCYGIITSSANVPKKFIVIRICCAHMMKNVCELINTEVTDKSVAGVIKEIFAGVFNITSFDELVRWFTNVNLLLCNPTKNAKSIHALDDLLTITTKDKDVISEIKESENLRLNKYDDDEDDIHINQKDEGLRKSSPFYTHFRKIYDDVSKSNEVQYTISCSSQEANPYYFPKLVETFLNRYMPFTPMFVPIIGQIKQRLSNNAVERFFGILKLNILNSSRDLRPTTFIRKVREHVLTVNKEVELDLSSKEKLGIAPKMSKSPMPITANENLELWNRQPKKRHMHFTARHLQVQNVPIKIRKSQAEVRSIDTHSSGSSNIDKAEEKWSNHIKTTSQTYFDAKRLKRKLFTNLSLIPESPENVIDLTQDQSEIKIQKNEKSDKQTEAGALSKTLPVLLDNALVDNTEFYVFLETFPYVLCSYKKTVNTTKLLNSYQFNTLDSELLTGNTMDILTAMLTAKYGIKRNMIWSTERATSAIEKGRVSKTTPVLNSITYMPLFAFEEKWLLLKVNVKNKIISIFNPFGTFPQQGKEYLEKFRFFLMQYNLVQHKPIETLGWKSDVLPHTTIDASDCTGSGILVCWFIHQFLQNKHVTQFYDKADVVKELRQNLLYYSDNMTDLCLICGKIMSDEEQTIINWIQCSSCCRWVHNVCDQRQLKLDETFSASLTTYYCILCCKNFNLLPLINKKNSTPQDIAPQTRNLNNKTYSFKLSTSDITILLDPSSELTDNIINRFGELLNNNSDYFHQDVLFCNNNLMQYIKAIDMGKKNIQILYGGNSSKSIIGHWICTFYDGKTINIYDSLNTNKLYESQRQYLKKLYPFNPTIEFHKVQQQSNAIDCGLFAIAFSVSLYFSQNPENVCYDNTKMREHIYKMIKNERLEMFPEIT